MTSRTDPIGSPATPQLALDIPNCLAADLAKLLSVVRANPSGAFFPHSDFCKNPAGFVQPAPIAHALPRSSAARRASTAMR
jgi:hypothetical protein